MQKNTAGQRFVVYAFDPTNHLPVTGDAANITSNITKDYGTSSATNDVNPTETQRGFYEFTATQAETNANAIQLFPVSSTANVQVVLVEGIIYTTPVAFGDDIIQTGDSFSRLTTARMQVLDDWINGGRLDDLIDSIISIQGTPATTTIAADIAVIAAYVDTLESTLGTPFTTSIGNDLATISGYVDSLEAVLGTPFTTTIGNDLATIAAYVDTLESTLGSPAGVSVSADLVSIKSDTATNIPSTLATIAGYIDTEIQTLLTNLSTVSGNVNGIQTDLGNTTDGLGALKTLIDNLNTLSTAIKLKTDSLNFTVAGEVNSNIQSLNNESITGNGSSTPFNVA